MTITEQRGAIEPEAGILLASALGPDIVIEAAPVQAAPPRVSLLTSAVDVTAILEATYGRHWLNGLEFEPEVAALNLAADFPWYWQCPEAGGSAWTSVVPAGIKQIPDKPSNITYRPFTIYVADPCESTFGMFGRDAEARALRALEANLARIVENEFWTGTRAASAGFLNDALTNANGGGAPTALNGGSLTGYVSAFADLEQGYFDRDNRPGVIHAQPRLVQLWNRNDFINLAPSGRYFQSALGTIVVPGTGYTGSGTGVVAGTHAQSWAYATGPVMFARTPGYLQTQEEAQRILRTTQDRIIFAECQVAAFWDSKVKIGVKVDHLTELS